MASIVLVHGAWHGPWCFDQLVPELEEHGWEVTAVPLPVDDPTAGAERYAEVIAGYCQDAPEVTLLGHSLSGLALPLVPTLRPVRQLIYLASLIPEPGRSWVERIPEEEPYGAGMVEHWDRRHASGPYTWWDPEVARDIFYHDAIPEVAEDATARLTRQAMGPLLEPSPVVDLTPAPSTYIACSDDRTISPRWGADRARRRLQADVIDFPGGHSPFLTRPSELADLIDQVAKGAMHRS